jgi:hypothetical protein
MSLHEEPHIDSEVEPHWRGSFGRLGDASGIQAISRGVSAATPPEFFLYAPHPGRDASSVRMENGAQVPSLLASLPGCVFLFDTLPEVSLRPTSG